MRARVTTVNVDLTAIGSEAAPKYARKPDWLRVSLPAGEDYERVKAKVNTLALNTVCKEAACPNLDRKSVV